MRPATRRRVAHAVPLRRCPLQHAIAPDDGGDQYLNNQSQARKKLLRNMIHHEGPPGALPILVNMSLPSSLHETPNEPDEKHNDTTRPSPKRSSWCLADSSPEDLDKLARIGTLFPQCSRSLADAGHGKGSVRTSGDLRTAHMRQCATHDRQNWSIRTNTQPCR